MNVNSIYDILNIIDTGIVNNNKNKHYNIFINNFHNFVLESQEIHFDYRFDLLKKSNYILTKLYEIDNKEFKKEYYELRELNISNLERIQDDKDITKSWLHKWNHIIANFVIKLWIKTQNQNMIIVNHIYI